MSDANQSFLGRVMDVSDAQQKYNDGMAEADRLLATHKINTKEHAARVAELKGAYSETTKSIIADLMLLQLTADGVFTDAELEGYLKMLERMGLLTGDGEGIS